MAYPGCDEFEVHNLLYNLNMTEQVVVFRAEALHLWPESYPTLKRMVENNWPIAQLHERYDKFINDFRDF